MFRDIIQSNRWLVPGFTAVAGVLAFLQFGWWGVLAFVVVLLLFAVVALGVYASRLRSRLPPALEAPTGAPDEGDRNDKALEEEAAPPSLADRESQRKADTDEGAANDVVVADGAPNLSLEIRADIAARRGNLRDVREVTEQWIDEAETDAQRLERRARGLVWESKAGSPDALAALRTLSDENPASSAACLGLAFALRELGEPERGANEIIARISSLEPEDQASASAQAALFLRQAGKPEASLDVARRALATEPLTREHEATLRNQIGLVLYELDRRVEALAHLEHAISLNPSDRSRRWDLAYKYSESGYREPAIVHYLALEEGGTSMTLNNLGASFGSI